VKVVNYDEAGNIIRSEILPSVTITHWSETPFRLGSANVRAEFLSLPSCANTFDLTRLSSHFARSIQNASPVSARFAMDLFRCGTYRRAGSVSAFPVAVFSLAWPIAIVLIFSMNF